jgi:hypothetical protein
LYNLYQLPTLQFGKRPGFFNLNQVTNLRLVILIMRVANSGLANDLRVSRVLNQSLDLNPPCLRSFIAGNNPNQYSPWHNFIILLNNYVLIDDPGYWPVKRSSWLARFGSFELSRSTFCCAAFGMARPHDRFETAIAV